MAESASATTNDTSSTGANPTPRGVRHGMEIGLRLIALVAGAVLIWWTAQVLLVLFAALFFAVFFNGLGRALQKRTRFSYTVCLICALLTLALVLVDAGLIVGPAIADQAGALSQKIPEAYEKLKGDLESWPGGKSLAIGIHQAVSNSRDNNFSSAIKFAGLTVHGFGGLIFAVVIGIFFAIQPDLYRSGFLSLFARKRRARMGEVLDELGFTLWWWLMGQLATMASVGILIGIGLSVFNVPLAGTLALIAAILSFIPSLGPFISVIPAIMLGITISPSMGLWVALLYLGVQILEANVITPMVQHRAISLPPAFVLASELLMGLLLGGAGLAFATPLAAVILVLVNMLYIQDHLKEPGYLPSDGHGGRKRASRSQKTH